MPKSTDGWTPVASWKPVVMSTHSGIYESQEELTEALDLLRKANSNISRAILRVSGNYFVDANGNEFHSLSYFATVAQTNIARMNTTVCRMILDIASQLEDNGNKDNE
jgi:hypothetical protein